MYTPPPSFLPAPPAVFRGADSLHTAETLGKIAQGGKPQNFGDDGIMGTTLKTRKGVAVSYSWSRIAV